VKSLGGVESPGVFPSLEGGNAPVRCLALLSLSKVNALSLLRGGWLPIPGSQEGPTFRPAFSAAESLAPRFRSPRRARPIPDAEHTNRIYFLHNTIPHASLSLRFTMTTRCADSPAAGHCGLRERCHLRTAEPRYQSTRRRCALWCILKRLYSSTFIPSAHSRVRYHKVKSPSVSMQVEASGSRAGWQHQRASTPRCSGSSMILRCNKGTNPTEKTWDRTPDVGGSEFPQTPEARQV